MIKYFLFFCIFCFINCLGSAQKNIGIPKIINYSHETMNAGTQNWAITQDSLGIIYVGNNAGLLTYNGKEWKLFGLPNKTIVRSVYVHFDGKIYVGGQDLFGYFFPDRNGILRFHSVSDNVPKEDKAFGDVWSIVHFQNKLFFRTSRKIFELNNNKFVVHQNEESAFWSNLTQCQNQLLAFDNKEGLFIYDENKFKLAASESKVKSVNAILDYNRDTLLLATLKDGLLLFHQKKLTRFPIDANIIQSQIYSAIKVNDNSFALGTVANGIYFINKKGQTTGHLSAANGLINNIILSLFLDKEKNLWAGLDDGVSLVNINSAIKNIFPDPNNRTASYAINVFENNLYIGGSDGLYKTQLSLQQSQDLSLSMNAFQKVPQTDGQVWSLNTIDNKLLMGHHEGAFQILDNNLINYNTAGAWIFRKLPFSKSVVLGTYNGLYFFKNAENRLIIENIYNKETESLRFVEVDSLHGIIWASHPYRGIYKMNADKNFSNIVSVQLFTAKDGLPTNLNNFVYKIDNEIVFATENGIYKFDYLKNKFFVDEKLKTSLGARPIPYLTQDAEGKIWFVSNETPGMLNRKLSEKPIFFPELKGKMVGGFYFFYPLNNKNIFIGANSGVIHFNLEKYNVSKGALQLLFNKIISTANGKDSLLNNGYFVNKENRLSRFQSSNNIPELPAKNNSFHFEFAADNFIDDNTRYSYKLEGFDNEWSAWSLRNDKDYTNLPHGSYVFKVKAIDNFGNKSPEISYAFYIQPFWYQTIMAKIIYLLLGVLGIFFIVKYVRKRMQRQKEKYEKEQAQLQHLHELEVEHNEREIIDLKNKNLETEINYKNKELATATMNLYKRSRLLSKLQDDLKEASKKIDDRENRKDITKVIKLIDEEERQNSDWEQFSIYFDDVHNNFLKRIKELYPELTPSDLKMCAYLKINLSSKEIAQILNISLKGVEIARYRLRKKLGLETETNLVSFLSEI